MTAGAELKECKVFIVEDSDVIVERINELLTGVSGVRFLGNASSITSVMEMLSVDQPDAVILDINLGSQYSINGIQLLNIIRAVYPALKIIMLTNQTESLYRRLCLEGGADYFFDKSNDFEKIPEALQLIVANKS